MKDLYKVFPTIAERAEQDSDYETHMNTIKNLDYGQAFYLVYEIEEMLKCWKRNYEDLNMSPLEKKAVLRTLYDSIPTIESLFEKAEKENKTIAAEVFKVERRI